MLPTPKSPCESKDEETAQSTDLSWKSAEDAKVWLVDRASQTEEDPTGSDPQTSSSSCEKRPYCLDRHSTSHDIGSSGSQTVSSSVINATTSSSSADPVQIPVKQCSSFLRPMRSIEGLNQEIERLVLLTSRPAGRSNRLDQVSALRGETPDHLRDQESPVGFCASGVTPQTLALDVDTDDSDASPTFHRYAAAAAAAAAAATGNDESWGTGSANASPRMKILAQLPPDGCERVVSRTAPANTDSTNLSVIAKPSGFELRPSQGSAFQPRPGSTSDSLSINS